MTNRPTTILLVEDQAVIALSEAAMLKEAGFDVETVYTGEAAVQRVRESADIGLILMDIDLGPGIDGTEAAARILQIRHLPVVFLTSHAEKEMVDKVKGITRYGYVLKNAGQFVLVESINMALELFSAHHETAAIAEHDRVLATLQSVLRYSPDLVSVVDRNERYRMVSESVAAAVGRSSDSLVGKSFEDVLPPDTAREFRVSIDRVVQSRESFSKTDEVPAPDGVRTYRTTLFPAQIADGDVTLIGVISVDLTNEVRAQDELRKSESRWQYALTSAGDGLWDWDAATDGVFFSPQWKRMLGYEEEEIGNDLSEWESRIHPADRDECLRRLEQHLSGETDEYVSEHRLRCRDGAYKWILDRGRVMERDDDGAPLRVIGTHADIDARKQMEIALAESEAKYRSVIETTSVGFWIVDENGVITEANDAYSRMSGYSIAELVGMPITRLDGNDDTQEVSERLAAMRETGAIVFETEHRRRDGSTFPVAIRANILSPTNHHYFAIVEDISDRRKAERQREEFLEQRELLIRESYHRIKNDMQTVRSLLMLQEGRTTHDEASSALRDAAGRVDVMTRIYDLIYHTHDASGTFDASKLVAELVRHIVARYGESAPEVRLEGEPLILPNKASAPLGVITNELITNAVKYAFDGMTDAPHITIHLQRDGQEDATLTVHDNGRGFPDPAPGDGSAGLGMTLITAFASQLGGTISFANDPRDGGATATLRFPTFTSS